jgi:hypothetical protein
VVVVVGILGMVVDPVVVAVRIVLEAYCQQGYEYYPSATELPLPVERVVVRSSRNVPRKVKTIMEYYLANILPILYD